MVDELSILTSIKRSYRYSGNSRLFLDRLMDLLGHPSISTDPPVCLADVEWQDVALADAFLVTSFTPPSWSRASFFFSPPKEKRGREYQPHSISLSPSLKTIRISTSPPFALYNGPVSFFAISSPRKGPEEILSSEYGVSPEALRQAAEFLTRIQARGQKMILVYQVNNVAYVLAVKNGRFLALRGQVYSDELEVRISRDQVEFSRSDDPTVNLVISDQSNLFPAVKSKILKSF